MHQDDDDGRNVERMIDERAREEEREAKQRRAKRRKEGKDDWGDWIMTPWD